MTIRTGAPAIAPRPQSEEGPLRKGVRWLDEYTSPRPGTEGSFKKASYFQAVFQGGTEGFYLMGPLGVVAGAGSAVTGSAVVNKTNSRVLGVLSGAAVGAGLAAATAAITGLPLPQTMMLGGLLGSFQTIRSDGLSKVRDSGGNATMISAFFVPGPAKMAGGIGAAAGARFKSPAAQALVGAATGAAVGAGLAAIGFAPVSVAMAAVGSGVAGAVGPFIGPRFSQFFRNLAEDLGDGLTKVAQKVGLVKEEVPDKVANAVGAVPAAFIKEGLRGFQMSDGGLAGFVVGGIMESIQQAHIMFFSDHDGKDGAPKAAEPTPSAEPQKAEDQKAA